jgi:endonuclease-3
MLALPGVVDHLAAVYAEPGLPPVRPLFELVLWENVAYLVDDAARAQAFDALRQGIGLEPESIQSASDAALESVTGHGILAGHQASKLREIARIAREKFGGDVESVRGLPLPRARRALMQFPSIGEPGAEKILLFAHVYPVFGLDSNGVRVLTRLGLVAEARSYSATYRGVQRLAAEYAELGIDWLERAHLLLRQHGQELCRRNHPACERCPLNAECAFAAAL